MKNDANTALPLAEARRRIAAALRPVADVERVPLIAALDRVLAHDLVSTFDVPAHDNAAMDGYALPRDRSIVAPTSLRVVGEARAGRPFVGAVPADACVRIMTGAVMPAGCDAVVPQEQVVVHVDHIRYDGAIRPGQHRRLAGEDLAVGAIALRRGRRIAPADLGVAASIGAIDLGVFRRPRVAVFSTGNELREPEQALEPGTIRDANRYTVLGMLRRLGIDAIDLGIVPDDPVALAAVLTRACSDEVRADAIVTSGGVSVGDADHTRAVTARMGGIDFWTLAVKPGRPMAFGRVTTDRGSALLFGLPGNPVAVMVVFYALVRDALIAMSGATPEPLASVRAVCDSAIAKAHGRTDFVRGVLALQTDGWHVRATRAQGSGVLCSMSEANGLIVLDHEHGPVAIGDRVDVWPFHGLI